MGKRIAFFNDNQRMLNTLIQNDNNSDRNVVITTWFNKPWNSVLRCIAKDKAKKLAYNAELLCNNINLSFGNDTELFYSLCSRKNQIENLTSPCECNNISFIEMSCLAANITIPKNSSTLQNLSGILVSNNFLNLTDKKYTTSATNLLPGDILYGNNIMAVVLNDSIEQPIETETVTKPIVGYLTSHSGLYVRPNADFTGKIQTQLSFNQEVEVLSVKPNHIYKIKVNNIIGYVKGIDGKDLSYTEYDGVKYVIKYIIRPNISIHSMPDLNSPIVYRSQVPATYTISKIDHNWGYISARHGWVELLKEEI